MKKELSDLQRDSLMETFNIGVGKAARNIAKLTGAEVAMSAPIFFHIEGGDISQLIDTSVEDIDACAVTRYLSGIDAEVGIVFQGSRESLTSMSTAPLPISEDDDFDQRSDIATKIGNLVMESCIDQIEDLAKHTIIRHPIKFFKKLPTNLFSKNTNGEDIVVVKIDFRLRKHDVDGHLLFSFSRDAANTLASGLDDLIS